VWILSQDPVGCRLVQTALDLAPTPSERRAVARELEGRVLQVMRCPHGNHVLQKCISIMPAEDLQFIIDPLEEKEGAVVQASKNRYGCRILQQLMKKCPPRQVHYITERVLGAATSLACHTFGNYAVQCVMKFGSEEQKHRLVRCVEQNVAEISRSVVGGGVLEAAIANAAPCEQSWIARAVARDPEVLLTLALARRGHASVLLVLEVLRGTADQSARAVLVANATKLKASRYGRVVAHACCAEP